MFKGRVSIEAKLLIILMAFLLPSIPVSAEIDNCCFVDRQCRTNYDWVSGYYALQNNHCAAPSQQQQQSTSSQPQSSASAVIDNCCFIGWQCATDEEWTSGYWAFQKNQCGMPTGSPSQSQSRSIATEEVNNCCFIGWQCSADEEWIGGYFAFQEDQCSASQADWQAQWRQRQTKTAARTGNQVRHEEDDRDRDKKQTPVGQWWDPNKWYPCGLGWPCEIHSGGGGEVVSITINLGNPNKRSKKADDGTTVIIDPDL